MSKSALAAVGLILGAVGFGLGYYSASFSVASAGATQSPELSPGQSREALLQAIGETDPFVRAIRLGILLPTLSPEAVKDARWLLEDSTSHLGAAEVELLMRFWAIHKPEGAGRWALTMAPLDFRTSAIVAAFETWAKTDPDAAVQQLMLASAGWGKGPGQSAFIRGWYASGLPGLEDYIRAMGVGFDRQRTLGVLARAIIHRDGIEAAMNWAESIPDEPWRYKIAAYRWLGSELAKVDLEAAVAWCERHCEDQKYGLNLRERVALLWAYKDGQAAMKWVASAPPGTERDLAVRAAFRGWRREDQEGLFRWIEAETRRGAPVGCADRGRRGSGRRPHVRRAPLARGRRERGRGMDRAIAPIR
jgi:hypothetical protein